MEVIKGRIIYHFQCSAKYMVVCVNVKIFVFQPMELLDFDALNLYSQLS